MEQEETIDYNIRKTWYNITKMYNRTAIEYMGSMALAMIVLNIDMIEGTPSTQLGPNMGMEATSLSRSLKKLEKLGIIARTNHQNDKRKVIIKLTKLGLERREIAKRTVLEFNNSIMNHFTKEEMDNFFNILKKINRVIDERK